VAYIATVDLHGPHGVKLVPAVVGVVYPSAGEPNVVTDRGRGQMTSIARHELDHQCAVLL
jgi:hypothetical protein